MRRGGCSEGGAGRRRAEHRVTGDQRRVHPRWSAGRGRSGGTARYDGVVVRQCGGGVRVSVHAGGCPASLGGRRLDGRTTSRGRRGEVEERSIVDGAERRQTSRRDQRARRPKHVRRLLTFLPFRSTILEPDLPNHKRHICRLKRRL